ncbi:hypothetical protein K438DRAFT_1786873 [Mycena galopus ATCC 62051]|nr:hypothetical protein K438DRAFT_1786873 [Mycena galopus ATCC 62051]
MLAGDTLGARRGDKGGAGDGEQLWPVLQTQEVVTVVPWSTAGVRFERRSGRYTAEKGCGAWEGMEAAWSARNGSFACCAYGWWTLLCYLTSHLDHGHRGAERAVVLEGAARRRAWMAESAEWPNKLLVPVLQKIPHAHNTPRLESIILAFPSTLAPGPGPALCLVSCALPFPSAALARGRTSNDIAQLHHARRGVLRHMYTAHVAAREEEEGRYMMRPRGRRQGRGEERGGAERRALIPRPAPSATSSTPAPHASGSGGRMAAAVALRIAILAVRGGRQRRGAGMRMEIRGSTAGSGLEENGGDEGEESRAEGLGRREMGRRRAPSTERNNAWRACARLPPAFFTRREHKSLVAHRQQAKRRQYPIRGAPLHSCLESEEIKKRELLRRIRLRLRIAITLQTGAGLEGSWALDGMWAAAARKAAKGRRTTHVHETNMRAFSNCMRCEVIRSSKKTCTRLGDLNASRNFKARTLTGLMQVQWR